MRKGEDITGKKFGRLTVLHIGTPTKSGKGRWRCLCECGGLTDISISELKKGQKYCSYCVPKGRPSHGLSHLPEYQVWRAMKSRCDNPKTEWYENYGGRGIKYCDRWKDFEMFYLDMGGRPSKDHTLERKENDGDYEPSNCKWATRIEQARNFRSNVLLEFNGEKKCISEWGEIYGMKHDTISGRLQRGYSVEDALTKPLKRKVK
jgi:hypothetical protein